MDETMSREEVRRILREQGRRLSELEIALVERESHVHELRQLLAQRESYIRELESTLPQYQQYIQELQRYLRKVILSSQQYGAPIPPPPLIPQISSNYRNKEDKGGGLLRKLIYILFEWEWKAPPLWEE